MRGPFLAGLLALGCASMGGAGGAAPATDQPMPDLTVQPMQGRTPIRLASLKGKVWNSEIAR